LQQRRTTVWVWTSVTPFAYVKLGALSLRMAAGEAAVIQSEKRSRGLFETYKFRSPSS